MSRLDLNFEKILYNSSSDSDSIKECNYLNKNYKNTCKKFDVFKDSCTQNTPNYYNSLSTMDLINLLTELKLKKRYFKKCYEERIIFSKKCVNNTYDYGHKKVIVLNNEAESKCDHEVYIINKLLRF